MCELRTPRLKNKCKKSHTFLVGVCVSFSCTRFKSQWFFVRFFYCKREFVFHNSLFCAYVFCTCTCTPIHTHTYTQFCFWVEAKLKCFDSFLLFCKLLFGSLVQQRNFLLCVCKKPAFAMMLNDETLNADADTVNIIHKIIRTCCWIFMSKSRALVISLQNGYTFFTDPILFKRFASQALRLFLFHSLALDNSTVWSKRTREAHAPCTSTKSSLISDTSLLSSLHLFPPPPTISSTQTSCK